MKYGKFKFLSYVIFLIFMARSLMVFGQESVSYKKNYDEPYRKTLHLAIGSGLQGARAVTTSFHVRYDLFPSFLELGARYQGNVYNSNTESYGFTSQWGLNGTLQFGKSIKKNVQRINLEVIYLPYLTETTYLKNVGDLAISWHLSGGLWGRDAGNDVDLQHVILRSGNQMIDPALEANYPMDITTMGMSFGIGRMKRYCFGIDADGYGPRSSNGYIKWGLEVLYLLNYEWDKIVADDGSEFEVLEREDALIIPWGARWFIEAIAHRIFMRANIGLYPGYELDPVASINFGIPLGMGR